MWEAILKNGSKVSEMTSKWSDIKGDIDRLFYVYNSTRLDLPPLNDKIKEHVQWKSASANLSGGEIDVQSQTIGVILKDGTKILLRFSMKENKMDVIVE